MSRLVPPVIQSQHKSYLHKKRLSSLPNLKAPSSTYPVTLIYVSLFIPYMAFILPGITLFMYMSPLNPMRAGILLTCSLLYKNCV